jgi:trk system potassium uptake protein TrkA
MLCKELGVKNVIAKISNEMHSKILIKVGADKVVFPEKDSGIRLAKNLISSGFVDAIELTDNIAMIELNVKNEWVGKTLLELNLRKKYSLNVIAIKEGKNINIEIDPNLPLSSNMKLIVIGNTSKISKLK